MTGQIVGLFQPACIGIVGGGQLGRMLVQAAARFGCECIVLDPDPNSPAGQLAARQLVGSCHDAVWLRQLAEQADVITYEIEDIDCVTLAELEQQGQAIYPSPRALSIIQDKLHQKQFLQQQGIPSAAFVPLDNPTEAACAAFGYPLVQKARRGGYDGRGVCVMREAQDYAKHLPVPSLIEACVPIKKELAVLVARGRDGNSVAYPTVEMRFHAEHNILDKLLAPADIPDHIAQAASDIAVRTIEALDGVGIFGVELFLDEQDQLLVNEIAPRTHNSGHHTLDANLTDQFEQQLRAILGLPLGSTETLKPAVMVNVLGAPGHFGSPVIRGLSEVLAQPGVNVHWYAKQQTRPYRKMGHMTVVGDDLAHIAEIAEQARQQLQIQGEAGD